MGAHSTPAQIEHIDRMLRGQPELSNIKIGRLARVGEGFVRKRRALLASGCCHTDGVCLCDRAGDTIEVKSRCVWYEPKRIET